MSKSRSLIRTVLDEFYQPVKPVCPHCSCEDVSYLGNGQCECNGCGKDFDMHRSSKVTEGIATGFIVMTVNGDMHNHYGPYEDEDEAEALAKRIHGQVYPLLEPSYSDEPEPAEDRPAGIDY